MDMDVDSNAVPGQYQQMGMQQNPPMNPQQIQPHMQQNMNQPSSAPIPQGAFVNGQMENPTYDGRPHTSYSDTGFRPYGAQPEHFPQHGAPQMQQDQFAQFPNAQMNPPQGMAQQKKEKDNPSVVIKVGMVGDAQIGKTSLMVKYVEGSWDEDYIQTLGVNFMEKTVSIRQTDITFSIWDLGGQREFVNMLPLVCNDAVAILFMFDLTRKSTLNSIKEWYRQGRGFNKTAIPFLVGTKYDHFVNFPAAEQEEISNQARRFAKAMKASLIFSSTSHSINVQKVGPFLRSMLRTNPVYRFSRLSSPRLSISSVRFGDRESWRATVTIPPKRLEYGNWLERVHEAPM